MMHLAEINEVIKASPAIQIQSKITHLQRRAWNVLLANAYNELPNKDIHRVSVTELAKNLVSTAETTIISRKHWRHLSIVQSSGMF